MIIDIRSWTWHFQTRLPYLEYLWNSPLSNVPFSYDGKMILLCFQTIQNQYLRGMKLPDLGLLQGFTSEKSLVKNIEKQVSFDSPDFLHH